MLARALPGVPVLVGADRYLAGPAGRAAASAPPCTCSTMGFSISQLARDVDLLLRRRGRSGRSRAAGRPAARAARRRARAPTRCSSPATPTRTRDGGRGARRSRRCSACVATLGAPRLRSRAGDGARRRRRAASSPSPASPGRSGSSRRCAQQGWEVVARAGVSAIITGSRARDVDAHRARGARRAAPTLIVTTEKDAVRLRAAVAPARRGAASRSTLPMTVDASSRRPRSPRGSASRSRRARAPRREARGVEAGIARVLRGARRRGCVRAAADAGGARAAARRSGASSTSSIGSHRRIALDNLAHAFPARPAAERRALARGDVRALRQPAARAAEVRHAVARGRCCARVEFEGRGARPAGLRAGPRRAVLHRHFGFWEMQAMAHALRVAADVGAGAAARQPARCTRCSSASARAPATR